MKENKEHTDEELKQEFSYVSKAYPKSDKHPVFQPFNENEKKLLSEKYEKEIKTLKGQFNFII